MKRNSKPLNNKIKEKMEKKKRKKKREKSHLFYYSYEW